MMKTRITCNNLSAIIVTLCLSAAVAHVEEFGTKNKAPINEVPKLKTLDELMALDTDRGQEIKAGLSNKIKGIFGKPHTSPETGFLHKADEEAMTEQEKTNREIGKMIQFMNVISHVDNFISNKAKAVLKGMHTLIDSDRTMLFPADDGRQTTERSRTSAPWNLLGTSPESRESLMGKYQWAKRDIGGRYDTELQAKRIQDLEKAKKFMQIVGQVDAYVSDRAKTLLKSIHNIIESRQSYSSFNNNKI